MTLFGLKNCDTCRAALRALREAGRAPELVDVRETPLAPDALARFLDAFGEALVNRRSTTWRGLSEAERQANPQTLLAAHPALMKRPVVDDGGTLSLGWGPEVQKALLG